MCPGPGFLFHILDFYSSGDVSVGLEWLGAGGGGSIEHKGQEDVSRLLLAVSTHTVGKTFKYKYKDKYTYTKKYKYKGQENHSRLLLAASTHKVGKSFVKRCWQKRSVLKCLVKKTLNQIIRPLDRNSPKSVLYLYLIKGVPKFETL